MHNENAIALHLLILILTFNPGGTEIFSRDLFRELCRAPEITGAYLAGTSSVERPQSPGTTFRWLVIEPTSS